MIDTLQQEKILVPQEIIETNIDKLTPLQALNLLNNIKKKYENGKWIIFQLIGLMLWVRNFLGRNIGNKNLFW